MPLPMGSWMRASKASVSLGEEAFGVDAGQRCSGRETPSGAGEVPLFVR